MCFPSCQWNLKKHFNDTDFNKSICNSLFVTAADSILRSVFLKLNSQLMSLSGTFITSKANSSLGVRYAFNFSCTAVKFYTNISRVPGLTQGITTKNVKYKRHWRNPFRYHSNDTKRNPWVMLFSHCPINDSSVVAKQYRLPCSYVTSLLTYCRG